MSDLITLTEFKDFAGIDHTNDDTAISAIISSVSAVINAEVDEKVDGTQTTEDFLDGGSVLLLKRPPVIAVRSVLDTYILSDLLVNGGFEGNADNWTLDSDWVYGGYHVLHLGTTLDSITQTVGAGLTATDPYYARCQLSSLTAGGVNLTIGGTTTSGSSIDGEFTDIVYAGSSNNNFAVQGTATFNGFVDFVQLSHIVDALVSHSDYRLDPSTGMLTRRVADSSDFYFNPCPDRSTYLSDLTWGRGGRRWRVEYTNGHSTTPEDVKWVVKELVQWLYDNRDVMLSSEGTGDASVVIRERFSYEIRKVLSHYKDSVF